MHTNQFQLLFLFTYTTKKIWKNFQSYPLPENKTSTLRWSNAVGRNGTESSISFDSPPKGLQKQGLNQAEIMSQNSIQASHMGGRIPNKPSVLAFPGALAGS